MERRRKGERVKRRGGTIIARRSQRFEIRFGAKIKQQQQQPATSSPDNLMGHFIKAANLTTMKIYFYIIYIISIKNVLSFLSK